MKRIFAVLLASLFVTSIAKAQSLGALKELYKKDSPLAYQEMPEKQVVEPGTTDLTPAEEQLAEMKAKDLELKKAQEERIYLDTDYQFFQALNITLDEDELDQAYKAKLAAENMDKLKNTDATMKSELKTAPGLMTRKEGAVMDEKRVLILKKIAVNGQYVRACILQNKKPDIEFKGTSMTLAWEVDPTGKVVNTQLKATDVENKEIQTCVLKTLAEWNFGDAMKAQTKNSHIEYTYRFVNAAKEAANKPAATTASASN
jgi:hypothetical protein